MCSYFRHERYSPKSKHIESADYEGWLISRLKTQYIIRERRAFPGFNIINYTCLNSEILYHFKTFSFFNSRMAEH